MRRGLFRVRGADGLPDDVRVEDDGIEIPVDEKLYRARGYLPPVDDLPWQEDYGRRQASSAAASIANQTADKADREQARKDFQARFDKR